MKMRVRENSVRFRLTKGEVERFAKTGLVEETVDFGGDMKLIYALESKDGIETVKAEFINNRIVIFVPPEKARSWANSAEIGIEAADTVGDGKTMRLLIEKDFECLDRRESDEDADAFPHPSADKAC